MAGSPSEYTTPSLSQECRYGGRDRHGNLRDENNHFVSPYKDAVPWRKRPRPEVGYAADLEDGFQWVVPRDAKGRFAKYLD